MLGKGGGGGGRKRTPFWRHDCHEGKKRSCQPLSISASKDSDWFTWGTLVSQLYYRETIWKHPFHLVLLRPWCNVRPDILPSNCYRDQHQVCKDKWKVPMFHFILKTLSALTICTVSLHTFLNRRELCKSCGNSKSVKMAARAMSPLMAYFCEGRGKKNKGRIQNCNQLSRFSRAPQSSCEHS